MSRLMKPLAGDLADRQTILELKINHSNVEFDGDNAETYAGKSPKMMGMTRTLVNKNAVSIAPFLDELELVRKELEKNWVSDLIKYNKVEDYDKLYDTLSDINSQLWTLEDKIRALKVAPESIQRETAWMNQVVDTAMLITELNDRRASIVKEINALWGYSVQEKMHQ